MKKLSILTTPAIALGVGILCAPQALAAGYTLSQTNLETAAAAPDTAYEGVFCANGFDFCTLSEGDWTQEGNIDLTTVEISGTPIQGLVLQNNVNISNPDGETITGNIGITGAGEVTLTDLNVTGSVNIGNADAEVIIDGGSYAALDGSGALYVENAKTVTLNNAAFAAGSASAAYIGAGDITINGGSFVSEGDHGIEIYGFNSLNITGGTFTGGAAGLAFDGIPDESNISLSGGTFTGTGTNGNAIIVYRAEDTAAISNMLADGYYFTNSRIATVPGLGGGAYIAGTTTVTNGEEDSSDESEDTTEEASSSSTSSKGGIGAPDTGAPTAETNASSSSAATIVVLATAALMASGFALVKKHSKRA